MKGLSFFLTLALALACLSSCTLFSDGYLFIGDGWQQTPEDALATEADTTIDDYETLTPVRVLDTFVEGERTYLLFINVRDELVQAAFVSNDDGEYHYYGSCVESYLSEPNTMVHSRNGEQYILFEYFCDTGSVWGYKYSDLCITVNEREPDVTSYSFSADGREWQIDRFRVDNIDTDGDIIIEKQFKKQAEGEFV